MKPAWKNINTQSPDGKYFYQITKPKDIHWGLFVTEISFFDHRNKLLYYKRRAVVSELEGINRKRCFATYLSNELVYVLERKGINQLTHVLIDLSESQCKRVIWTDRNHINLTGLGREFQLFNGTDWQPGPIDSRKERDFLFRRKWFPIKINFNSK